MTMAKNLSPEEREKYLQKKREHAKRRRADPEYLAKLHERDRIKRQKFKEAIAARKKRWGLENREKLRAAEARWRAKQTHDELRRRGRIYEARSRAKWKLKQPNQLPLGEILARDLRKNAMWLAADQAVRRSLPQHIRDDAVMDLFLALFEGRVAVTDLRKAAARFVTAAWGPRFGSLDAAIPGTDGLRLLDKLSNDTEHF